MTNPEDKSTEAMLSLLAGAMPYCSQAQLRAAAFRDIQVYEALCSTPGCWNTYPTTQPEIADRCTECRLEDLL